MLPHGPQRTLTVELHGLHQAAGLPPARLVEAWVRGDPKCTETVSHTTFRTMLRGATLVGWIKWAGVVRVLAAHAVPSADSDAQIERFHSLWLGAAAPTEAPEFMRAPELAPAPPSEHTYQPVARQLCMPVYIVVDAPGPSGRREAQFDHVLGALLDQLAFAPRISELAHVCVVAFSREPYVVVELTDLNDLIRMPKVTCLGAVDYAASFALLRERMTADIAVLGEQGWAVRRPLVLLLSNGGPAQGDNGWHAEFRRLIDPAHRARPHIMGYGFTPEAYEFVKRTATFAAFRADLNEPVPVPGEELVRAVGSMLNSMVSSAVARRMTLSIPDAPAKSISTEDLD
ncbi:hypothetical protein A8W25_27595 [Streptomyces sp. ERV7]|nr:hypothetical protein A8W25_27595 [Streptomyces sp. ERV7]